ncbi:MAG: zinc-ribbon domain-containing protein, partial [Actinobacteria bacterium]
MATCPRCGQENPEGFKFCGACGASLAVAEAAREVRKTVTVVFCDVTGSTALGEQLDPESLRRVMARYFDEARTVLERHGGTVEKFIGDAVMAVFGVPVLHEDDALRAVRASIELRDVIRGLDLTVRIGVNTGEVVAGEGGTLVTGDAVNVAARLEQSAPAGNVLIGGKTYDLVQDAVFAEPLEPLSVKGKSEPVPAFRLVELLPEVPAFMRPVDAPFVGRSEELETLKEVLRQVVEERSCRLGTIVGPPGIGKSRLARELVALAGEARILVGRCLPYGEGITYWPLVEVVHEAAGSEPEARIRELVGGDEADEVAARIAGAIGAGEAAGTPEETAWAFRRLFEALARERPLIVAVDDIHWAEPTMLDLLEYVLSFTSDAPTPRPVATLVTLQPLSEDESEDLVDRLLRKRELADHVRARIVEAAEGNPLFVEQLLAMIAEDGAADDALAVPPTIQALLAARIDRLESEERSVIERASVEGRMFHRGAVAELLPEAGRPTVGTQLLCLIRKEFIRPH